MAGRRKVSAVVLGAGISALALFGMTPTAGAARNAGLTLSTFELRGTHGYTVSAAGIREADSTPLASIMANRSGLSASYQVPADSAAGIHATFGSLGSVSVRFKRTSRTVDAPERGCRMITERGVFLGSFSFVGEGGYTVASATNPRGKVLRLPSGFCAFGNDRRGRLPTLPGLQSIVLGARADTDTGRASFQASSVEILRGVEFEGSLQQRLGNMRISRSAYTTSDKSSFVSHGKRAATVHPPAPFKGSASFRDTPTAPPTWTGSLSVSLPGAPSIPLTGEGFAARLCPHIGLLSTCWPKSPRGHVR